MDNLNIRISRARKALDDVSEKRSKAVNKFIEGTITESEKDEYLASLDEQKIDRSAELESLEQQQQIRESDIELAINVMHKVHKQWKSSDLDNQYRFQSMLFPRGVVYDSTNHQFGTSEISELYRYAPKKKTAVAVKNSHLVAGAGLEPATLWL